MLRAYGIKTTNDVLCRTPAEAVKAAKAIGFPVVMKVSSPDLLHKSDAGLVRVGVGRSEGSARVFTTSCSPRRSAPTARPASRA